MNSIKNYLSLIIVTAWLFGLAGWVLNIVEIYQTCCDLNGLLVLRVVGIFIAPLGAILGYF